MERTQQSLKLNATEKQTATTVVKRMHWSKTFSEHEKSQIVSRHPVSKDKQYTSAVESKKRYARNLFAINLTPMNIHPPTRTIQQLQVRITSFIVFFNNCCHCTAMQVLWNNLKINLEK